jgi:elongation factor 1 alpha-like protein
MLFFKFILVCEEFDYDDENLVGSVSDEQECISPTDASQWIFDRARGQSSLDEFLSKNEKIQEESEEEDSDVFSKERRDSENYQLPELNDVDKGKLFSCMDGIRNIIGETYTDKKIVETIIANDFDFNKALDKILNGDSVQSKQTKPKVIEVVEKGIFSLIFFHNAPQITN